MKTRTSHLVYLLLWLVVLAAYVTALSMLPHAPNVLMVLPAGLGGIAAAQCRVAVRAAHSAPTHNKPALICPRDIPFQH